MQEETWLGHMAHLEEGDGYRKGCRVCSLRCTAVVQQQIRRAEALPKTARTFREAQQSGRRSVRLDEMA